MLPVHVSNTTIKLCEWKSLVKIRHIVWGSLCLLMYIVKSQGFPLLRLKIVCVYTYMCVNIVLRLYYFSTLICIPESKYYLCFTLFKFCLFETVAHSPNWSRNPYVNQLDFEFAIFLSLPPNYWNFRHVTPHTEFIFSMLDQRHPAYQASMLPMNHFPVNI